MYFVFKVLTDSKQTYKTKQQTNMHTHSHPPKSVCMHMHAHTHTYTHTHTHTPTHRHIHTYTEPSTGPSASSSHLPDDELSAQSVASLNQLLRFPRWQRLLFAGQGLSGHDGVELLQNDVLIIGCHQVKTAVKDKEKIKPTNWNPDN